MASDQPGTTALGRPKPQQTHRVIAGTGAAPPSGVTTSITGGTAGTGKRDGDKASSFEFRGFDFFANRDFNELKNASRAYFAPTSTAEKHQRLPSTWLGDATPPTSPRPSEDAPAGGERAPPPPLPPLAAFGGQRPSEKKIFGLRRSQFWWILALVALLLIVAIGVGVGVGVGRSASQKSTQAAAAASSISTTSPSLGPSASSTENAAPTTSASTSSPSTSSTSTSTPTGNNDGKIDCPAANGTTYQVPGSDKRFLRICGIDYSGDQAQDLRQVPTESILDCMKNCAGTFDCTGCGWGYLEGDTGTQHTCFLKGNLKKPHEADINWAFAVLL
ncbi:hypothetical protein F5Y05DRAFT_197152 [Hypoxylon sp. FL0543]|nr:hypothetical protein F5Y05DRAFT_197152 [Hypoxylon sp. FL0543]